MIEQKLKSDNQISIGKNIRDIRLSKKIGQTELVRLLDLQGILITRESLVKIERGIQHIYASQLKGIKISLDTTYDELLK
ncbi:MAG: transcriptional regulator [Clostridia bacterium]